MQQQEKFFSLFDLNNNKLTSSTPRSLSLGIKVDLTPDMVDKAIQEDGENFDDPIIKRESFLLNSGGSYRFTKAVINREDLLQDICGREQKPK